MYLKKQISIAIFVSILFFLININGAQITWTGAGSNDWNTLSNWSTSSVPTANDTVIFTGSVTYGLILTSDVTVTKLIIENTFTQPINLNSSKINILGDCELDDFSSSFDFTNLASLRFIGAGPQNFIPMSNMEHPKIVTDCTSTAVTISTTFNPKFRAVYINVGSSLTAPSAQELIIRSEFVCDGTFNPNGGSVAFDSTAGSHVIDIQSSYFDSVKFNGSASYTFPSPLDVQGGMVINGPTLNMGSQIHSIASLICSGASSGTLNMQTSDIQLIGDLDLSGLMSLNYNESAKFTFTGSAAQSITPHSTDSLPNIHCMNSGGDVNFITSGPVFLRDIQIDAGASLTAPDIDTLIISNNFFNAGVFTNNAGAVRFDSIGGAHSIETGSYGFYNLVIGGSGQYNLTTPLTVENNLTLDGGDIDFGTSLTHSINAITSQVGTSTLSLNNSTLQINQNFDISNLSTFSWIEGATLEFVGTSPQSINSSSSIELPDLLLNNNGGDVNFTTGGVTNIKNIQINSGGSMTAPSVDTLIIRNNFTNSGMFNHSSGTVKFDTTAGSHVIDLGSSTFYNLYIMGGGTYTQTTPLSVENTLTLTGATLDLGTSLTHSTTNFTSLAATGSLNLNGSTLDILGNADFSNLMSFQWTETALLHFVGTSSQTMTPLGTLDHPPLSISNSSDFSFGTLANDITVRDLIVNSGGVFNAPNTYKLRIRNNFTNNGTFNHNNGIIEFDSTAGTHNINSLNPFHILNINGAGATYQFTSDIQALKLNIQNGTLDMGSSFGHTIDTITSLAGTSTLDFNNSRLLLSGNMELTNISTIIASTDTIELNGAGSQTISAPASIEIGHVLKSGSGTLSLGNNLDVSSYSQTDGTLSLVSFDLNVQSSGDLTINKGSITGLDARQILVSGDANIVGAPADSVFITPATVGYLNVTGSLNANYAVIGNVNANGSQGIAINSRDAGGNTNWAFPPATTVDLFFSVGRNTTNLLTSSSFSTNGDTAIFGTPQSDNIGIGDRIDYDGGFTAYIKERLSSTQYIIRKADGSAPNTSTVQVDAIYRAFNSLSSALDSINMATLIGSTNLKAINARLHLACYSDSIDTTAVNIYGFETGHQNGISIFTPGPIDQVGIPQNHHGMWTTDGYQLSVSGTGVSGRVIWMQVPHVKIQGLQIEYTGSNANAIQTIAVEADSCAISNNIIRLSETTPPNQRMGIYIGGQYYTRIFNNLVYGFIGGSASDAAIYTSTGQTNMDMPVYNNTVYKCAMGIQSFPNNAVLAKNNLVYSCTVGYGGGTFATGSANNLSGPILADAPGSSALQMTSISFLDTTNGNFRLMYNTAAINMGVNLTSDPYMALDDDISFQPRDATFDIGAYEYKNNIPNMAVLDTFIAGETISTNTEPYSINLQFDISDSDTMAAVKFQLQIDDTSDFSSPVIDTTELTLSSSPRNNIIVPVMLNSGSYYWRVRTLDQFNAPSTWSIANVGSIAFTIDGPDAPTNIILSNTVINENTAASAVVGILSTIDPDVGNTFSYSFFAGLGDSNNSSFTITGDTLKTAAVFNYESQSNYSVLINSIDNTSLSTQEQLILTIVNVNEAPVDIALSNNTIDENLPDTSVVGILNTTDEDTGETFTYQLVAGIGDTDNNSFIIIGDTLKSISSFDYETKTSYTVRIRTKDAGTLTFEKAFTISVNDIAEDIATQMPSLAQPASNDTFHNFFNIDFTLPEPALASSVKMTFMQTGGTSDFNSPHVLTFNTAFEDSGNHTTTLNAKDLNNNTYVASCTSDPNDFLEHEGIYSIKIGYQDTLGNTLSEVIASNVMFTDTIVTGPAPVIVSSAYYEVSISIEILFDKKTFFIDSTKNFFLSTDNGISDTVIIQAPWSWSFKDTTLKSIQISVPTADISLLEGLSNKDSLEISMQDSTFGDSLAWNMGFDYSMDFKVTYFYENIPLNISSVTYIDSTNKLVFAFNDTITFIDTTKNLGLLHKEDTTLSLTIPKPWIYELASSKDTVKVTLQESDAIYIENWSGIDSSLSLILSEGTFTSSTKKNSAYNLDTLFPVNFQDDHFLYNMFGLSLNNSGDSAIEAYLYFVNDSIHDTGNGLFFNFSFGDTDIDTTLTPWAYKDSSLFINNTVKQGYWYFTWAPINLFGQIGEVKKDSLLISNTAPQINLSTSYSINEDSLFSLTNFVSDINGDSIYLSLTNAPNGLTLSQSDNTLSWTPQNSDVGLNNFTIMAIDSWGDTTLSTIEINVINVNDIPLFDTVAIADTIYEDSLTVGYIKAHDIDKGDSIKLFIEQDSNWIEITSMDYDSMGNFKFGITLTPDNNSTGLKTVKYHIQDNIGSAVAFFDTIFVVNTNDAPSISLSSKLINHGAVSLSFKAEDDFDTTFNFILNLTSVNMNVNDTNSSGTFNYYPLEDGSYELSCKVIDNGNLSDIAIDSFTISGSSKMSFTKSSDWNMITIPTTSYSATNFKNAGTILHWDETKEASNIYKYYTRESGINLLTSGNSYFIKNSDSSIVISLHGDSLIKNSTTITLNSGEFGWNQIGSPYTYPIKVEDSTLTFWEYDPTVKEYVDAQEILMPWKGYWIQTDEASSLSLNPTPHIKGTRTRRSISRHRGEEDWIYSISLTTEASIDRDNYFGFAPDATNGKDHFDRLEAPRMNDAPYLFFKPTEWQDNRNRFASDVRHKRSSEDFFSIGISGSSENYSDMKMKITGYLENEDVFLFTHTKDGISSYDPNSEITIKPSEKDQYITVISSWKPELSIPLTFKTFSPYPNPCKPIANIRYTLPYSWEADGSMISGFNVKIVIYDVKGRVIKELLNGKQKPGIHKVVWNGKNGGGSLTASGAYFVKIDAGKHRAVKKIMLMR